MSKRLKSVSLLLSLMCASPMGMYANSLSGEADVSMSQQKSSFSGTVKDATGEPIIGASVFIKNTTVGTVTDLDGNFQLQDLNKGDVIVVSFIGYLTQEIKYAGQDKLVVTLKEDKKTLDEVVVVGFGTQKKVNLTGAVGTVDSEALESRPVTNATQALQGLVPGLQISQNGGGLDNSAKIQVRGTATIGEGSTGSPLILIDGMEGDLNSINPQDIENISVLKDAAASSIYGSRAP